MKTAIGFVIGMVAGMLLAVAIAPYGAVKPALPACVWGMWGEAELTSDWKSGTRLWQKRRCEACGLAEMRVIVVSASPK